MQYNVYYREVILRDEKGHWNLITVDRNTTSYTLHLECWKQYEITVTSFYSYRESDKEDSKIWNFKTGTKGKGLCLTQVSRTPRSTYGYSIISSGLKNFYFPTNIMILVSLGNYSFNTADNCYSLNLLSGLPLAAWLYNNF